MTWPRKHSESSTQGAELKRTNEMTDTQFKVEMIRNSMRFKRIQIDKKKKMVKSMNDMDENLLRR